MGCGCGGRKWTAPANMAEVQAARKAQAQTSTERRTRELIPGGYWNGPQAKQKTSK